MAKGKFSLNFNAIEGLFKPKMPPLIGADISSSAVKMVEIADAGKGGFRSRAISTISTPLLKPSSVVTNG